MKGRRKSREDALQILYQLDLNQGMGPSSAVGHFEKYYGSGAPVDEFTQRLVQGVVTHLASIDEQVQKASENWRPERMAIVDRNILRLGCFELQFCEDIPATVSINEMIELAKEFGSENSPAFINGILDKISAGLNCPNKVP